MRKPHSSEVRLSLLVGGIELAVAQVGFQFLILREPPAEIVDRNTEATLIVSIDGTEERSPVHLLDGIKAGEPRIAFW